MPSVHGYFEFAVDDDERQEIAVPAADERDHGDGGQDRPDERQRDEEEEAEIPAPVHECGVQELARQLLERVAHQENAHRQRERDLRQDHAPIGIEEPQIADSDEQRQDRRREGKQEPELKVVQEKAIAEETQVGEGEGRHRGDRERQDDRQHGHDQRIAEDLPIAIAGEDAPIVLPHPDMRQAERI